MRSLSWLAIDETIYCVFIGGEALLYPDHGLHHQVPPFD
jgi:hypothetical protein